MTFTIISVRFNQFSSVNLVGHLSWEIKRVDKEENEGDQVCKCYCVIRLIILTLHKTQAKFIIHTTG